MPLAQSIHQSLGGAAFPLEVADVSGTGAFPDLLRDTLLDLVRTAVNYEFGNAADTPWRTVRTGTALATQDPVADSFPGLPTEQRLLERKGTFPFLFLDRVGSGEFVGAGAGIEQDAVTCPWDLTWCLGPLRTGEEHRFRAALTVWFPNLVRMVIADRCHPAYTPPGLNGDGLRPDGVTPFVAGDTPFGPGGVPIGSIQAVSFDAASVPIGENKELYHGVTVRLMTTEDSADSNALGVPFLGGNHRIRVGGHEGLLPGILELDTTHPNRTRR